MNFRAKLFWVYDYLRNNSLVRRQYDEINSHLTGPFASEVRIEHLDRILKHAVATTSFYKGLPIELSAFPVIDKAIVRSKLSQFISANHEKHKLKKVVTSGSTGVPFQIFQDSVKVHRNSADAIWFSQLAGFKFGTPLIYMKIWTTVNAKSSFRQFIENIVSVDVTKLSSPLNSALINKIVRKGKVSFLGYPSALLELVDFIEDNHLTGQINVNSIITMSEALESRARKKLSNIMKCQNVYSRYSNVENGILAQQFQMGSECFLINTASYHIEILDEDNNPEKDGNLGRIVVTDLFNFGMPLIRYDTGDLGILSKVKIGNSKLRLLERVEGRKMDAIHDVCGELVSSFVITNHMWDFPELLQYQFVQNSSGNYTFKLNAPNGFKRERDLIGKFKDILGRDAVISIEYVNEIPLLSSGKRKKVVNLSS